MIFMKKITVFSMGDSPALSYAIRELEGQGILSAKELTEEVTHILWNIPTKAVPQGVIPASATVVGGNLEKIQGAYEKLDLLQQEEFLAENGALTADCALRLLGQHLPVSFEKCPILVIGWGRIGKCLAQKLKHLGAQVTVAVRKASDRGMLMALGYEATAFPITNQGNYRAVINTVPAPVLKAEQNTCVYIDLASCLGIEGDNVIWARGLPAKMLPESAGKLIAQGILRQLKEEAR